MGHENGSELCSVPIRLERIAKWEGPRMGEFGGNWNPVNQC